MEIKMSDENKTAVPVQVNVDLNKMFEAYNKSDFMKQVFVEAITKNPKIFTEAISNFIIMEFAGSEMGTKIKDEIRKSVQELSNFEALKNNRDFCRELDKVLIEEIKAHRSHVSIRVKQVIDQPNFKERTAEYLASTVKERVTSLLGEVCSGCDRDIY